MPRGAVCERALAVIAVMVLAWVMASTGLAAAPVTGGIFTLNQDRLYTQSAFGKRVALEIAKRRAEITDENTKFEAELKAEELDLTHKRPTLDPVKFRKLADAFDAKVVKIRKDQATKGAELSHWADAERKRFFVRAFRILLGMAQELGAEVILDERSTIISSQDIDLTSRAVKRVDKELGDGADSATPLAGQTIVPVKPVPEPAAIKP